MGSFPYYSHTTPIRIPKDMGMVWEASHKGVPLLGVPENPIEQKPRKNTEPPAVMIILAKKETNSPTERKKFLEVYVQILYLLYSLFKRDPYFMVYERIPHVLWVAFHPL